MIYPIYVDTWSSTTEAAEAARVVERKVEALRHRALWMEDGAHRDDLRAAIECYDAVAGAAMELLESVRRHENMAEMYRDRLTSSQADALVEVGKHLGVLVQVKPLGARDGGAA